MIDQIRSAGVVGAGGAGFPTYIKLENKVDTVIANGVECEPLLANDKYLLTHHARDIIEGLLLAQQQTGADRAVLAIKEKYTAVKDKLEVILQEVGVELFLMPDYYPAGDELEIIYEVTNRIVPAGGLPVQVGVLVQNVETLFNSARAVNDEPVTHRYLTVNGAVEEGAVVHAPIGISCREVLNQLYPGKSFEGLTVTTGGVMMGASHRDFDFPVTKTTGALLLLPEHHTVVLQKSRRIRNVVQQAMAFCTQCTKCSDACPRDMLGHTVKPHLSMRRVASGLNYEGRPSVNAYACSECGICDLYACPMGLYPRRVNRELKEIMRGQDVPFEIQQKEYRVHPLRESAKIPSYNLKKKLQLLDYDREVARFEELKAKEVTIPLKQHIGAAAKCVVKAGQKVEKGEMIGEIRENEIGSTIHASISGRVKEITADEVRIVA